MVPSLPALRLLAAVLACILLAGCRSESGPPSTVQISGVELGRALAADDTISEPATVFGPGDTVYLSVRTAGSAANASLTARWTYEEDGQLVEETSKTIAPAGAAVTAFQVGRPSGFPPGRYKVVIALDGRAAANREFEIR